MNENNVLLLTQDHNDTPTDEITSAPIYNEQRSGTPNYIPLVVFFTLMGNSHSRGASPFFSREINPELSDMLHDIAQYMPQARAANIERASTLLDFISKINSPAQVTIARKENATPIEIYSSLKRYIPLPMRQTVDMLMTSASSVKGLKRSNKSDDPLDSIINTLSTMRNLKKGLGMAGAAAEIISDMSSVKNDAGENPKANMPDISKLMELMGTLFTKK
ncbi:MAG: hypothetical protein E7315_02125 [Clostridiales bacterium]|nr:hypothetical protein [Clostridiales bacterium]